MNTISKDVIFTKEINKSTFISYLKKVDNVDSAKKYIQEIKNLHPNATHHVTSYIIGKTGENGHCSDDGEPSGTAGAPILDVFKKNDITNFVIIVVRYFGGIKLGAGGLIRAYSSSASKALKEAGVSPIIEYVTLNLTFAYSYLKTIENKLKDYEILNKNFNTLVSLEVKVPKEQIDDLKNSLIFITSNQIEIK